MPPNNDPGFDDDGDDQVSTIREAETTPKEKPAYEPVVAPKSAFPADKLQLDAVIPMRITAINEDEVVLVCEPGESEEEEEGEEMAPESTEPSVSDFE